MARSALERQDFSGIRTRAVRGGTSPDPTTGAVLTPIYQTTTYAQEEVGKDKGYAYSRVSNPTVSALEARLGALENAPPAVCFATGLAAETALFLALLESGDHVVLSRVIYGGTVRLFQQVLSKYGISTTFVDTTDPENVRRAIGERTKLVFIETPGNPTLDLADIRAIALIAHESGIPLAVDNTFLTAALQQPLDLGADLSVYSTTKHIEGHNSTVGGAIVSRDEALLARLRFIRKSTGAIQSPLNAFLTLQGIKTLPLRLKQHSQSALTVARWLRQHPLVERVLYPGLIDFEQRELADRQHLGGDGGIVSFEVVGGYESALGVLKRLRLATLAENVGAVETLVTHSASMTHADVPREQRIEAGVTDGLIRLSVGLEDVGDIIADLDQALDSGTIREGSAPEQEVAQWASVN